MHPRWDVSAVRAGNAATEERRCYTKSLSEINRDEQDEQDEQDNCSEILYILSIPVKIVYIFSIAIRYYLRNGSFLLTRQIAEPLSCICSQSLFREQRLPVC